MKSTHYTFLLLIIMFFSACSMNKQTMEPGMNLTINNLQLCNSQGEPVQLRGISSHGVQWFGQCFTNSAIEHVVKEWNANAIRIAIYTDFYERSPDSCKFLIDSAVTITEKLGVHLLIDWHVLSNGNPMVDVDKAKEFWQYVTTKYKDKDHLLYEICNEPNQVEWSEVKKYANTIIPLIQAIDTQKIIIVGTPHWSSDLNAAVEDPLDYNKLMYAFHFYSKSHYQWDEFTEAIQKIPVFVSEWGTSEASGTNGNDLESADTWVSIFDGNNPDSLKISWINWSIADKDETCSLLLPNSCYEENWENLTISGQWIKNRLLSYQD